MKHGRHSRHLEFIIVTFDGSSKWKNIASILMKFKCKVYGGKRKKPMWFWNFPIQNGRLAAIFVCQNSNFGPFLVINLL